MWPLPLDADALARRRAAAETVLAHLDALAAPGSGRPPSAHDTAVPDDPEWPPPPDDDPYDDPYADSDTPYGEADFPYDEQPYADAGFPYDDLPYEEGSTGVPYGETAAGADEEPPYATPAPAPDGPAEPEARSANRPTVPHQAPAPGRGEPPAESRRPAGLTPEEARTVASWDRDLDALTGELLRARQAVTEVPLPATLTASQLLRLAEDPDGLAQELARPMPRPPQPAARRGTRFHAWVESRFEELTLPLLEPDELPGSDAEIADEHDLEALKEAFERTEYARRTPYRVEAPFQLTLAGCVVRGRIDAVYKHGDGDTATYEIVDWKTGRTRSADPLQLAVYRLAWAEQQGVPPESVTAAFLYVRTGEVVRPQDLPDRAALERLLGDGTGAEDSETAHRVV